MKRLLLLTVLLAYSLAAAQDNPIEVRIDSYIVIPDGTFIPATSARPSQVVEYWVFAENTDSYTLPAGSVSVNGPVTPGVTYIPGSASQGDDFSVEFTDDTYFVSYETTPVRAVRWTYQESLEPGEEIKVTYRVVIGDELPTETYADFSGFKSDDEDDSGYSSYGSADEFTQAMFGHLGVVQTQCPSHLVTDSTCGEVSNDFGLFRQGWDLYADYESEVPVIPTPVTSWQDTGTRYEREYELNGSTYRVGFEENDEGGLVIIYAP